MQGFNVIVSIIFVLAVVGFIGTAYVNTERSDDEELVACPADAKLCPDGSAVGRVGPECSFAPCPSEEGAEKVVSSGNTLDLSNSGLTEAPINIFKKTDTEILNLSGNKLTSLQAEVRHLSNLRAVDLSNNTLTNIPAELGQLSKLEVLNLRDNNLTGLPYELGNLANLKVLDLRGNDYAKQDLEIIKESLPASTEILTD